MTTINREQVYIYLDKKHSLGLNTHVYVEDIAKVYCKNKTIKKQVEKVKVYNGQNKEMFDYISVNDIITKILDSIDNIDVNIIGGPDILMEIKDRQNANVILEAIKILVICTILFFGSALAVIYFFEDAEMKNAVEKIHFFITGVKEENPKTFTIPFSIGIGMGIFAFFNRVFSFSKRRRQEPGPLEIELNLYDKDMEDVILQDLKNKDKS